MPLTSRWRLPPYFQHKNSPQNRWKRWFLAKNNKSAVNSRIKPNRIRNPTQSRRINPKPSLKRPKRGPYQRNQASNRPRQRPLRQNLKFARKARIWDPRARRFLPGEADGNGAAFADADGFLRLIDVDEGRITIAGANFAEYFKITNAVLNSRRFRVRTNRDDIFHDGVTSESVRSVVSGS